MDSSQTEHANLALVTPTHSRIWVRRSPLESTGIRWNPAEHVGECTVLCYGSNLIYKYVNSGNVVGWVWWWVQEILSVSIATVSLPVYLLGISVTTFYLLLLLFPQCLFITLTHSYYDSFNDSLAHLSYSHYIMTPSIPDSTSYYDSPRTVYKPAYYFCNYS